MIPTVDVVIEGFGLLARRYRWPGDLNARVIADAIGEARALATDERDEPAAVFFAFARRPKALRQAWPLLPRFLAASVAAGLTMTIRATPEDFTTLRLAIAERRATYEDVRRWFAERS